MRLFKDEYNFYGKPDNSATINFPKNITINENKAITDESIRLAEEFHDKSIKNIIAKFKVEDNLVSGQCFVVEQPTMINDLKLFFKFKINGKEFVIEKELSYFGIEWEQQRNINDVQQKLQSHAKAIMLWYVLRNFQAIAYEQITKEKVPDFFLK